MIGLPLRLLAREVYDKIAARVGADKVALITGEEKIKPERAALLGVHGRGDAARRRRRLPRDRRGAARRPIPSAATSSPTGCCTCAAAQETLLLGAQTMREAISRSHARRQLHLAPAAVEAHLRRREEDHAPAPAHGRRRVLGRGGLRDRRADPPPARRRGGGARRAVARARATRRWRSTSRATSTSWSPPMPSAWVSTSTSITSRSPATRKFDGHEHRDLTPAELARSPAAPAAT